jgi:hypothetical protein
MYNLSSNVEDVRCSRGVGSGDFFSHESDVGSYFSFSSRVNSLNPPIANNSFSINYNFSVNLGVGISTPKLHESTLTS